MPSFETRPGLDAPYGTWKAAVLPAWLATPIEMLLNVLVAVLAIPLMLFAAVSDMFMHWLFGRYYIYNVSWEDPAIESRLLSINEEGLLCLLRVAPTFAQLLPDRILTIASAGDNVLDYIVSGAHVTAVGA